MGKKPKKPKAAAMTAAPSADQAADRARDAEMERMRLSKGRASTNVTGGMGDMQSAGSLARKVLTGL